MRSLVTVPALLLLGFALSGCSTSVSPEGVLPRDPVPPPPTVGGSAPRRAVTNDRAGTPAQRRSLSVPGRS